jgi:hypothetical protein
MKFNATTEREKYYGFETKIESVRTKLLKRVDNAILIKDWQGPPAVPDYFVGSAHHLIVVSLLLKQSFSAKK